MLHLIISVVLLSTFALTSIGNPSSSAVEFTSFVVAAPLNSLGQLNEVHNDRSRLDELKRILKFESLLHSEEEAEPFGLADDDDDDEPNETIDQPRQEFNAVGNINSAPEFRSQQEALDYWHALKGQSIEKQQQALDYWNSIKVEAIRVQQRLLDYWYAKKGQDVKAQAAALEWHNRRARRGQQEVH